MRFKWVDEGWQVEELPQIEASNWEQVIPLIAFPVAARRIIYTRTEINKGYQRDRELA